MPKYGADSELDDVEQVEDLLNKRFAEITKTKVPQWRKHLLEENSEDTYSLYLKAKEQEILTLKEKIKKFNNPGEHFTKIYRTFEGHCSKLQQDLDRMDVFGREDLKQRRKKAYVSVDEMINILSSKAHESGRVCRDCEIQN